MNRILNFVTVATAATLISIPVFAGTGRYKLDGDAPRVEQDDEPGGHAGRRGRGNMVERLAETVELSADQTATIEALQAEFKATSKPLRDEVRTLHKQMRTLFGADVLDSDALMATQAQISDIQADLAELRLGFKLGIMETLTPAQRVDAREAFKKGGRRGDKGHRGFRGEGRGGEGRGHQADEDQD
jgi:Spy/CpxP family protein refolding chaperone